MEKAKKQEELLPVYLVDGEDLLKRQVVLKRLKARVEASGDLGLNFDSFSGESTSADAVIAACNTLPFLGGRRLVQVNGADLLKKADSEALAAYLGSPAPTTVLALVSDKLAANTKLRKAVGAFGEKAVISCLPQKRYELARTVRSLAAGHHVGITERAAAALIDLVGEDTVRLDNELRKIALAHQGADAVSESEVRALVAATAEAKPWEFVDAFSARDIARCLSLLARMDSATPYTLLPMCVKRLRELICARALAGRGRPGDVAAALKLPDWRVKNHVRWSQEFSRQELIRALSGARDVERAMKSGADPDAAFLEWVLCCLSREAATARATAGNLG